METLKLNLKTVILLLMTAVLVIPGYSQVQNPVKNEVPGPQPGTIMTKEYVYQMGKFMYIWGWPMVNVHNRILGMREVPEPGRNGGVVPVAPLNHVSLLTDYMDPMQRYVVCPNQDVAYGVSFLALDESPVVVQIPDFGDRFWVYQVGNLRTDGVGRLGKMYDTKPGFYLVVGPDWKGETPKGVNAVIRSDMNESYVLPRVFLTDDPKDKAEALKLINQIMVYPLSKFTGKMQTMDYTKTPSFPDPKHANLQEEVSWVIPEKYFDELPDILKLVPPLKGEESLYALFNSILDAAKANPELKAALVKSAVDAEKELIRPLRDFKNIGVPVGNYWTTPRNGAEFGTDYLSRVAMAKSNIFINLGNETSYFYQDMDSQGVRLNGKDGNYTITFEKGKFPPVKGFWSLTVYNNAHLFYDNPQKVFSKGTKNKDLKYNPDGSLTLYVQHTSPGKDKESNWVPAPADVFSVYLRAYWPDEDVLTLRWTPPAVKKEK